MIIYNDQYEAQGFKFECGLMTTYSVLGICLNLQDEAIVDLINNDPVKLGECLKEILPHIYFNEAHRTMFDLADENGNRPHYFHQWEDYFKELSFKTLSKYQEQADLILSHAEHCQPRAVNNAKIVLECLKGNYPPRYIKEKTPEETAKASFDKKKPKLRLKLTIRDGYKCEHCGKDKEDSLCVMRKDESNESIDLDNLVLRCRTCINKLKNKK